MLRQLEGSKAVAVAEALPALFEARRCLSCGSCFSCDNCYALPRQRRAQDRAPRDQAC